MSKLYKIRINVFFRSRSVNNIQFSNGTNGKIFYRKVDFIVFVQYCQIEIRVIEEIGFSCFQKKIFFFPTKIDACVQKIGLIMNTDWSFFIEVIALSIFWTAAHCWKFINFGVFGFDGFADSIWLGIDDNSSWKFFSKTFFSSTSATLITWLEINEINDKNNNVITINKQICLKKWMNKNDIMKKIDYDFSLIQK